MKREELEALLTAYMLGQLDWENTEKLESMLRSDPRLRSEYMSIQEGFEDEVHHLSFADFPSLELKAKVFDRLGLSDSDSVSRKDHDSGKKEVRWRGMMTWSGWGVAAVLLLTIIIRNFDFETPQPHQRPVLAVFEIPLDSSQSKGSYASIREVIYADHKEFDHLYEAELQAQRLWEQNLEQTKRGHQVASSRGFVVIDLMGNQGFVGLYDGVQSVLDGDVVQKLWLSYSPNGKRIPVGAIPSFGEDRSGVFYFMMDHDIRKIDSPESVIPIISSNDTLGLL